MKIRNGFVSNSSSSSFIVQIEGDGSIKNSTMVAGPQDIRLLEDYGFIKTSTKSPLSWKSRENRREDQKYMHYNVSCNEEEVMVFLMKNKIPFKSSCHYDCYYVMMRKDDDMYLYAYNFGNEIDMYGFNEDASYAWEQVLRTPKIERRSVEQFIKDNTYEDKKWICK